ncbi:lamin tail domain-containing protein [Microvirga arabica]|uniref:Lamin tail domain-containing protein n=1 Tax=Microvirga arabica TaxID=1128671 RepID=A0ABV6Y2K2_9HYPH
MASSQDLFISEYIEGSSNNKAIEIYNGTGAAIDLGDLGYKLRVYFNGSTGFTSIQLTGVIQSGQVFVFASSSADPAILAQADQTTASSLFNGDDAIALVKGDTIIDVIGQIGSDPGTEWGSGPTSTADNTLRRKALVTDGDTDGSNVFDPAAQWEGFATNTFSDLGQHNVVTGTQTFSITEPVVQPVEGTGETGTSVTFMVTRANAVGSATIAWSLTGIGGAGQAKAGDFLGDTSGTVAFAEGEAEKTITIIVAADAADEGNEAFSVTLSNPSAGTVADGMATTRIQDDDTTLVQIAEIQGAAHTSPKFGQFVTTTGIVTGKTSNGFWIQDATPDNDVNTSDGVFVFTGSAPASSIVVGDEVQVSGTVDEFFPNSGSSTELSVTQIRIGSDGEVVETGNTGTIQAQIIGTGGRQPVTANYDDDALTSFDATTDGVDFWESLEGMVVTLNDARSVGPSFTSSFGDSEVFAVVDDGAGAGLQTPSGGLIIQEGDFNPEKIAIQEDNRVFDNDYTANTGDRLGDVTGIVSYDSRSNYEVIVTQAFEVTSGGLQKEGATSLAAGDADHLTVATYNAENLDANDPASRFTTIAAELVSKLKSPDIVALQEIQDDNGTTDNGVTLSEATLQKLVAAIELAGGPKYSYTYVAPENNEDGGQPGGNIRQVFLYNAARVQLADPVPAIGGYDDANAVVNADGNVDLAYTVGRLDPTNAAFEDSRKPLAAEFVFNGEKVILVNNHFNSKGGDDPLYGVNQPPIQVTQTQRLAQAEVVAEFVESIYAVDEDANVVVLGDLNDFGFSKPVERLEEAGLFDLSDLLPENERYDYVFDGNSQDLDHIMVSDALIGRSAIDVLRINAEFAQQTSDHDPLIARLAISKGIVVDGGNGADQVAGGNGNDSLSGGNGADRLEARDGKDVVRGGRGDDVLLGGRGADQLFGEQGSDLLDGGTGTDLLTGGAGSDAFLFRGSFGNDTVADFRSEDVITFDMFANFTAVQAASQQVGADTVITAQDGSSVRLKNVLLNSLQADDFAFI